MEPERWRQIERLYYAALERAPEQRAAFLTEACAGDENLRCEVVSFLAASERIGSFLEVPPEELAEAAPPPSMIGQTLTHYRVISLLGKGGMGEVYLGEDTTLGRKVALKLLPAAFTTDQARLRRFAQEARAASALNHPNIITIHEISQTGDTHYLVTEYIEGETLRQRLAAGRLKLNEAVEVAVQVASALAAAHAAGITHRDIKPENVMVRPDGLVKVLDFGLAKLTEDRYNEAATRRSDEADSTLLTAASRPSSAASLSTDSGMVLGTPRYMSPEQARGLKVDARTDLFSLGVVLYEMLTGRAPFAGLSALEMAGAILHQEPAPLRQHLPDAPAELQRIVSTALCKEREQRYQHSKDLLFDLSNLRRELEFQAFVVPPSGGSVQTRELPPEGGTTNGGTTNGTSSAAIIIGEIKRHKLGVGIVLALFVAGLAFGLYQLSGPQPAPNRAAGPAPRIVPFTSFSGNETSPAFAPDGAQLAFAWNGEKEENTDIYVKLLDAGAPLRLTTHPDADLSPAWSPDGRYIAFSRVSKSERGIFIIPALGGPERKLATTLTTSVSERVFGSSVLEREFGIGSHLSWSPDGKFLAFSAPGTPQEPASIFLLSVETLEKRQLLPPSPGSYWGDEYPAFSPDGKTLAFVRWIGAQLSDLYSVPTAGGEPKRLTFENKWVGGLTWTPDGREIIFSFWFSNRGGAYSLWRIPASGGAPERLAAGGENGRSPALARQGNRLAYVQSSGDRDILRLALPNAAGQAPTKFISSTRAEFQPQFSPDGKRIAFESNRSGGVEIWVCESNGLGCAQVTSFSGPPSGAPRWSPTGERLAFDSVQEGNKDIYVISVEGGKPRRLTTEPSDEARPSWSRDGRWIYFGSYRTGNWQVWKAPAEGGQAVQVTKQGGREAFESLDGKFVYYTKGLEATGLWRTPVAGGAEVQVLEQVQPGLWAVLEQGIYFLNLKAAPQPTIELFSFATARTTRIAVIEKKVPLVPLGFTVSPDRRGVLMVQEDQRESDIILMENFR